MIRTFLLSLLLSSACAQSLAAEADWRRTAQQLEGCWEGEGMGGTVFECWVVAEDGRADGMLVMRHGDKPTFSQSLVIDDFGDGMEMRLKHVHPDMTGWEEKDDYLTFAFQAATTDSLNFKGLLLTFESETDRKTELDMKMSDGERRTVPFTFKRMD